MMAYNRFSVVLIAAAAFVCGLLQIPASLWLSSGASATGAQVVKSSANSSSYGTEQNARMISIEQIQDLFTAFVGSQFATVQERLAVEALVDWAVAESETEVSEDHGNFEPDENSFNAVVTRVANSLIAAMPTGGDGETKNSSASRGQTSLSSFQDIETLIQKKKALRDSYESVADAFWSFVEFSRMLPRVKKNSSTSVSDSLAELTAPTTVAVTGTPGERNFYRPSAGNSEVTMFLNVSPMVLLNRICRGQRVACAEMFQLSLYSAIQEVANDDMFTQDRLKMGNVGLRGSGVQQAIIIYDDGDLRFADVLESALEDVQFCREDPSRPICQTITGQTLAESNITPKVISKRVIE
ncbi:hypothetical protein TGARI_215140 [Toxoplasma gondii ARI]|uniref:Uncharacterized protein n=1 Tax=Toxoplasma gondii ARI TaxID=1074872 RepID=A0A139XVP4_TOXGO|nr:hypothetical protein TGARI_215140 [Toxoplasma gondii ARI]